MKQYADLGARPRKAARAFAEDVAAQKFPAEEHCYARGQGVGPPSRKAG